MEHVEPELVPFFGKWVTRVIFTAIYWRVFPEHILNESTLGVLSCVYASLMFPYCFIVHDEIP